MWQHMMQQVLGSCLSVSELCKFVNEKLRISVTYTDSASHLLEKVKFSSKEECPGALVHPWGRHRVPLHTVSSHPS